MQPQSDSLEEAVYQWLEPRLKGAQSKADFLWAADLQSGLKQILYVDEVHYSAGVSRIIADKIAAELEKPLSELPTRDP